MQVNINVRCIQGVGGGPGAVGAPGIDGEKVC